MSDVKAPLRVMSIVGARPNFMKVAPIIEAIRASEAPIEHMLVHTGQHYDEKMSQSFFVDLGMPEPDLNLGVGSGSQADQTGRIMMAIEQPILDFRPDVLIVVGDVNSTMACAITARKLGVLVAHVEAGLRSRDMTMPEEINRLCTDAITDIFFTADRISNENLRAEGVPAEKIHFIGNVMIDTLMRHRALAENLTTGEDLGFKRGHYGVLTLHRPANVDTAAKLGEILDAILDATGNLPIIFPAHPRTIASLDRFGLRDRVSAKAGQPGIHLVEPLGYLQFLNLTSGAKLIMTDSGGLQEESTVLQVPCVTIRDNTERPITIEEGTNILAGTTGDGIRDAIRKSGWKSMVESRIPEKWDGKSAERIVSVLGGLRD